MAGSAAHLVPRLPTQEWEGVSALAIASFHPRSSGHRPQAEVRIAHDGERLRLCFRVAGSCVVSRELRTNGDVYRDSCVEFFAEPIPGRGYFNLESNAGGTLHCRHIRDPQRLGDGFVDADLLTPEELARIAVTTSLPRTVSPEITTPLVWTVDLAIPFDLYARRLGAPVGPGQTWRANCYSCAEECSQPHWASWAPIGERLEFHQPDRFGTLRLAD
jgi:hypothetical protein